MNNLQKWPALSRLDDDNLPRTLVFERAIWGKVHGESSDFRWIARSQGFTEQDINRSLHFGAEDKATDAICWLVKNNQCFAIKNYPSNSTDAMGRSGFLEKQILSWSISVDIPLALVRLILLPIAEQTFSDQHLWKTPKERLKWDDPQFYLEIDQKKSNVKTNIESIQGTINKGIYYLNNVIEKESLIQFYAQILSKKYPILFKDLKESLPAAALAVLYLPLVEMEQLSVVNGMQSAQVDFNKLMKTWDIINIQKNSLVRVNFSPIDLEAKNLEQARKIIVPALLENNPDIIKSEIKEKPQDNTQQQANLNVLDKSLQDFCDDNYRRWFDLQLLQFIEEENKRLQVVAHLTKEIKRLSDNKPEKADKDQWQLKIELLNKAAFKLTKDETFNLK